MHPHPMFERILAGTDGTPRAEEAVRQAARLAAVTGAHLEVVFVAHPAVPGLGGVGAARLAEADAALERARLAAEPAGVAADVRVLVGEPARMLAVEAVRRWSDLVCVGPDAGVVEKPRLLGGVAAHLVHPRVPTTPGARPVEDGVRSFPSRILVRVDGSNGSREAVRLGASIALAANADLRFLHSVEVAGGPGVGWTLEGQPTGFEPLEPAVELAAAIGVTAAREMAFGRPGPAIAAAASAWQADLVVVGARGRSGLERLALGSVSDWVIRHAGRSVLVAGDRAGDVVHAPARAAADSAGAVTTTMA